MQLGERLAVRFAFPLERVPGFRDRYLNGEADLSVGCENGVVEVFVRGVRANGRDLPAWMLRDLSRENFATRLYDRPDARDVLKRIAAIRLSDDGATLTTKGK
ncbi:MAG: hypothetical protein BWZ02_03019 [Lentisphaerae bacterium ADurb.BinA184]|nr:MAG: hypothetical protein BWZ02_03019 [Lentisphaerae bacterium ADurb.BinA184]